MSNWLLWIRLQRTGGCLKPVGIAQETHRADILLALPWPPMSTENADLMLPWGGVLLATGANALGICSRLVSPFQERARPQGIRPWYPVGGMQAGQLEDQAEETVGDSGGRAGGRVGG